MITQAVFEKIQNSCLHYFNHYGGDDVINAIFPKLFVLHNPSKQGFYVDKNNNVILSVSECTEPEHVTKIPHSCPNEYPHWARSYFTKEFTTYVLETS